jgi:NADH-quinone oxidoreductase subunit J
MLFFIFSGLLCVSALQTVTVKNPVYAALFLILSFVSTSALFIIQGAEFLGLVLILVYVGAVMVLFLFVVMMLDVKALSALKANLLSYVPMLVTIGGILVAQIVYILHKSGLLLDNKPLHVKEVAENSNNTRELGKLIFTEYLLAFEVVGCILLVAILVAVILTLRSRKDTKSMEVSEQIKVKASDRIVLVDSKIN